MPHFFFFNDTPYPIEYDPNSKLRAAITCIEQNHSLVAQRALEVIHSDKVTINSFFELSKTDYLSLRTVMEENYQVKIPLAFPPSSSVIKQIEYRLDGIVFNKKNIYLKSNRNPAEIARTLVHEIAHVLNKSLFNEDLLTNNPKLARYKDEIRSFTAEKRFERNDRCLLRSDVKKIHQTVTERYAHLMTPETSSELGYIAASYDSPSEETSDHMSLG
ncbi:MAG: hypothetical protein ACHP65_09070 [Legionellales bacterium]